MKQYDFHEFHQRSTFAINKALRTHNLNLVLDRICYRLMSFDEYIIQNTISNWSKRFNLPISYFQTRLAINDETTEKLSSLELMQNEMLKYTIVMDKLLRSLTITDNTTGEDLQKSELKYRLKKAGLKVTNEDFDNVLEPLNKTITVVKEINPIKKIFQSFADNYKGGNHIKEFTASIPVEEFESEGKPKNYYKKKMEYFVRKWLYLTAGQALGLCSNHAMLLFISGTGGSGKTYLNRWLGKSLADLEPYYTEIIGAAEYAPYGRLSIEKFFINLDELPLNKNRYDEFKGIVSSNNVQIYHKKFSRRLTYDKLGVFCGSTNKCNREGYDGYIKELDGGILRRIIPIELPLGSKTDWQRYTKIDIAQLWGEAAHGIIQAYKQGDNNMLTYNSDDHKYLSEANKRYLTVKINNAKPFLKHFLKDAPNELPYLKSSTEILDELKTRGYSFTQKPEAIGMMLSKSGFKKGRTGGKRGYFVEFI